MTEGLQRKLRLFPATNIVVANMIGAGIFTTSGLLMEELNNPLLMLSLWIAGGVIALCGALSYGELGAAMPEAGGEYYFLSKLYHPLLGFLSGWVSFIVGFSAPIAASAMGFSEYLCRALPAIPGWLDTAGLLTPAATRKFLSVSVIIIFTYIHYNGLKTGTAIQNVLTFMKIGLILLLIFAGFASGNGNTGNFISGESISPGFAGWKTAGLSLMWIMFAYSGWNASTYIGSEIASPSRILPRSLMIGTGSVIMLYLGLNALFIYAISPDEMKGVISVGGLAMGNLFGKPAEILVSILISFALFSSLSAFIIIGPRVYYSMAKDGLFFRFAAKVHPRHKVPSNSILLQCLIAVILALSGTFDQVLTYMGFALGIFPILAVTGIFSLRRKKLSGLKIKGYPFTQILYIVTGASILVLSFLERPAESLIALATALTGIPVYYLFKRRNLQNSMKMN